MRVQDVMTPGVETVVSSLRASEAKERMRTQGIRHLVVKDGRTIVGVLSDRDVRGRSAVDLNQVRVADLMTRSAISIAPDDTVRTAANVMRGRSIGCLPVVDRGRLVGIVTTTDLLELVGGGVGRPVPRDRASVHYRVPHRKQRRVPGAW